MALINFSGLASGIDTNSLIDATSKASRAQKVDPLTTKINELTDTDDKMEDLKTKFNALKDSIYNFTTIAGGGIVKTATSSNEAFVSATATNAAANGSYSLTVNQLARNGTYTYGHSFSSSGDRIATTAGGHSDGTVTVEVGTGSNKKTLSVAITKDVTTLSDFVSQFNAQAAANGNCALASIVQVGASDYRVMISSSNTGQDKGTLTVTSNCGFLDTGLAGGVDNPAQNAQFSLNGVNGFVRQSNSVADVINGVNFTLQGTGSATVSVGDDPAATETKIQDWVDKYNEIVTFISENNRITRDESGREVKNIFSPLANTSSDDTALSSFREALASIKSTISGTAVNIMADLGITTQRDGTLKFNKTEFEKAMAASSSSVASVLTQFADKTATTGGTIDLFTRYQGSFDITINSNKSSIDSMTKEVSEAEQAIAEQEAALRARFARLEALMSKMQQQQTSLTSALKGLA